MYTAPVDHKVTFKPIKLIPVTRICIVTWALVLFVRATVVLNSVFPEKVVCSQNTSMN